jgi:hypothetical protein
MKATRIVVLATALLMTLAGCGSADGGDGVASAGGTSTAASGNQKASEEEQAFEFVACMREHGIDLPDPEPDGEGGYKLGLGDIDRDDPALLPALEACRDLLPDSVRDVADDPKTQDQLREFAKCMREHGIDLPDPDPNGGFGKALADIDRDSPAFQKAAKACEDKLPQAAGR